MDIRRPTPLLGGLSPAQFMRRHWQKKPLLVRGALPGVAPPVERAALFALAGRSEVESRLVVRDGTRWVLKHGPFARRALPPAARPGWTLLVQAADVHVDAAHALLQRFRFVPDARLDDLMVSYASDGGGVGAHVDSYDVFLLQVQGQRRWRVGRARDATPLPGLPLAILANFAPTDEWVLDPGDLLYLPPGWGHEGTAVGGDCMTCSIGFRSEASALLADALLERLADLPPDDGAGERYRDPAQAAAPRPARIPAPLAAFAQAAVRDRLARRRAAIGHALGEWLSEPRREAVFAGRGGGAEPGVRLDRATRMVYDRDSIYINGERFRAGGSDARLLRRLADERRLAARAVRALEPDARAIVQAWLDDGWLHAESTEDEG